MKYIKELKKVKKHLIDSLDRGVPDQKPQKGEILNILGILSQKH